MTFTKDAMIKAHKVLENAGYTKVCSVMHSGGATGNYGSHFIKKGHPDFWCNKDTFNKLPV